MTIANAINWGRQPQYQALLNPKSSLRRGLWFAVDWRGKDIAPWPSVSGQSLASSYGTYPNSYGTAVNCGISTSGITTITPRITGNPNEATFLTVCYVPARINNAASTQVAGVMNGSAGGGAIMAGHCALAFSGGQNIRSCLRYTGGAGTSIIDVSVIPVTGMLAMATTGERGARHEFWVNGGLAGTATPSANDFEWGNWQMGLNGTTTIGPCPMMLVAWQRSMSPQELAEITTRPWSLFGPMTTIRPSFATVVGGSTPYWAFTGNNSILNVGIN